MISVDNFYWVLFETLLKPSRLDCWYYHPWGTKGNLSMYEFQKDNRREDVNHVLFHFDQEPIWETYLGDGYDKGTENSAWCIEKRVKILANSEHSQFKRDLVEDRGFLDWYFFYHGFAVLDWYRDAQYITPDDDIRSAFLSFNHIIRDHRSYRISLLARLIGTGAAERGSISFHGDINDILGELQNPNTRISSISREIIDRNIVPMTTLPWKLDQVPVNGDLSARFGYHEYQLWQRSLLHVVNETVFYEPKLHLTEKVFKPIVCQRPFVLVAAPGNLAYLRGYGFRTFGDWIDESYDDIQDPDQRLDAVAQQVARFAAMTPRTLRAVYHDMLPVLEHNKRHLFGKFRQIIVNELVDNFDHCVCIWNNGRVDERDLPRIDVKSAKRILGG